MVANAGQAAWNCSDSGSRLSLLGDRRNQSGRSRGEGSAKAMERFGGILGPWMRQTDNEGNERLGGE